jgi:hypothetical protein
MNFDDMHHFTFHEDPGHGWLEVTFADLKALHLCTADFSECSYISGNRLFLEEDLDAGVFLNKAKEVWGKESIRLITELYDDDCFVRDLPRIR